MQVRLPPEELAEIDGWILTQKEKLSRPEAIRRLTKIGLGSEQRRAVKRLSSADQAALAEAVAFSPAAKTKSRTTKRGQRK